MHASNTDTVESKTGCACVVEGVQKGGRGVFCILKYKNCKNLCTQEKLRSIFRLNEN